MTQQSPLEATSSHRASIQTDWTDEVKALLGLVPICSCYCLCDDYAFQRDRCEWCTQNCADAGNGSPAQRAEDGRDDRGLASPADGESKTAHEHVDAGREEVLTHPRGADPQ